MSNSSAAVAEEAQAPRRARTRPPIRSAEIRAAAPQRETRRHKRTDNSRDAFYIPKSVVPKGFTAEWKTVTVHGEAKDPSYMVELEEQGWKPATVDQFPMLVPAGYQGKSILRKGMLLMVRPDYLTEEARAEDLQIAREQVRDKLRSLTQTGQGEMDRRVQRVKRSYERPPADDDGI